MVSCHDKNKPADCASRGMLPSLFFSNNLWCQGPSFLKENIIIYKKSNNFNVDLEQYIRAHISVIPGNLFFERYSTLTELVRVMAYCQRFLTENKQFHITHL